MEKVEYSSVGKLEILVSKLWQVLMPIAFLKEDALDAEMKIEDCFLLQIYNNNRSGGSIEDRTIATRLMNICHSDFGELSWPPIFNPKRIDPVLKAEIYDTYQYADDLSRKIYINRIKNLGSDLIKLWLCIVNSYECLEDFQKKLPYIKSKITPEFIRQKEKLFIKQENERYAHNLPETLHTSEIIINFLPLVLEYIILRIKTLESLVHDLGEEIQLFPESAPFETDVKPKAPEQDKFLFKSFEDLFINPEDISICIKALRIYDIDKPIISDSKRWQKRNKSKMVLAAWIKRMEICDKIKFIANKKLLVPLLNDYFPGLNLGKEARTLADYNENIIAEFAALIM